MPSPELKIRISADGAAATAGLKQVKAGLGEVERSAATATASNERLANSMARLGEVERTAATAAASNERLAASMARLGYYGAGLGGLNILGGWARSAIETADAYTTLENRLRLATGSADAAARSYSALFKIAQDSRVSFVELGGTYAQLARSTEAMGLSSDRLLKVTAAISQAMTISGGSAASMKAALIQLSQGIASGVLRGDELNSVLENSPRLAMAITQGLNVSIGKLREMAEAGELTAERVIGALEKIAPTLDREFRQVAPTVGQAFTNLENSVGNFIRQVDKAGGYTASLASGMISLSGGIDQAAAAAENAKALIELLTTLAVVGGGAAAASGLTALATRAGAAVATAGGTGALLARVVPNPVAIAAGALTWAATTDMTGYGNSMIAPERRARLEQQARDEQYARQELDRMVARSDLLTQAPAGASADYLKLTSKLAGNSDSYLNDLKTLHAEYERGGLTVEQYRNQVAKLIETETEIGKAYAKERDKKPPAAKKEDLNAGQDLAAGKAYASAMEAISRAQDDAALSGLNLNGAQAALMRLMQSPEWERMPENWQQLVIAQTASATATIDQNKELARLDALMRDLPLEQSRADMALLAQAYLDGKFGIAGSTDAIEQYGEAVRRNLGTDALQKTTDEFSDLRTAIAGWGKDSAAAIVDFAITGKSSFGDMINSMIADLMRMVVYQRVTGPLFQWLGAALPATPTAAPIMAAADGAVFSAAPGLQAYANTVRNTPTFFNFGQVHAFASGGVFAEAGPEAVMPLSRMSNGKLGVLASGGGSDVVVNLSVINQAGGNQAASSRQSIGADGAVNIEVMLYERVVSRLQRDTYQGAGLAPLLETRYGLNPAAGSRR